MLIEPVGEVVFALLVMIPSLYYIEELRTLFGKLLTFYNLFIVSTCINIILLIIMHYWIIVNSQIICHTAMICFVMSYTGKELFATTILTHLAYLMYRCYWLKSEISSKNDRFLFRCYVTYALVLLFFLTITYDWRTENGRNTLLPNGHCNYIDQYGYNSLFFGQVIIIDNKFVQITMFLVYLVYFYKLKADFRDALNSAQYNQKFFRIAFAMGATFGLSHFIWMLAVIDPDYTFVVSTSSSILLLIQQVAIMSSFMCTTKISELCKACFSGK